MSCNYSFAETFYLLLKDLIQNPFIFTLKDSCNTMSINITRNDLLSPTLEGNIVYLSLEGKTVFSFNFDLDDEIKSEKGLYQVISDNKEFIIESLPKDYH